MTCAGLSGRAGFVRGGRQDQLTSPFFSTSQHYVRRSQLTTLLLVLGRILNIKLIVVGKPYCCLLLVLNINNNNFS
jgi:hypothetical protein